MSAVKREKRGYEESGGIGEKVVLLSNGDIRLIAIELYRPAQNETLRYTVWVCPFMETQPRSMEGLIPATPKKR